MTVDHARALLEELLAITPHPPEVLTEPSFLDDVEEMMAARQRLLDGALARLEGDKSESSGRILLGEHPALKPLLATLVERDRMWQELVGALHRSAQSRLEVQPSL